MFDQQRNDERGLSEDEVAYVQGSEPRPTRIERRRPGWMVVGMFWATFGLYLLFWAGFHWAELKRQLGRDNMYPLWHALSIMVPIYSYYQYYRNFSVQNELMETTQSPERTRPFLVIATFLLASLLVAFPIEERRLLTLNLAAAMAAISWTIYHGQSTMNIYFDNARHVRTTSEVKLWERLLIAAGAGLWSLLILSALFFPQEL
jgi:hypothetical protein